MILKFYILVTTTLNRIAGIVRIHYVIPEKGLMIFRLIMEHFALFRNGSYNFTKRIDM